MVADPEQCTSSSACWLQPSWVICAPASPLPCLYGRFGPRAIVLVLCPPWMRRSFPCCHRRVWKQIRRLFGAWAGNAYVPEPLPKTRRLRSAALGVRHRAARGPGRWQQWCRRRGGRGGAAGGAGSVLPLGLRLQSGCRQHRVGQVWRPLFGPLIRLGAPPIISHAPHPCKSNVLFQPLAWRLWAGPRLAYCCG